MCTSRGRSSPVAQRPNERPRHMPARSRSLARHFAPLHTAAPHRRTLPRRRRRASSCCLTSSARASRLPSPTLPTRASGSACGARPAPPPWWRTSLKMGSWQRHSSAARPPQVDPPEGWAALRTQEESACAAPKSIEGAAVPATAHACQHLRCRGCPHHRGCPYHPGGSSTARTPARHAQRAAGCVVLGTGGAAYRVRPKYAAGA